jgi:preprotein translocase subunit SecE
MPKDDNFWLNVGYIIAAVLFSYVLWLAAQTVGIQTGWLERYDEWFEPASIALSILLGVGIVAVLRMNKEKNEYFLSSISELRKVSWPSPQDTRRMTIIVCVVVAIFAVILSVFDVFWAKLLKYIIV